VFPHAPTTFFNVVFFATRETTVPSGIAATAKINIAKVRCAPADSGNTKKTLKNNIEKSRGATGNSSKRAKMVQVFVAFFQDSARQASSVNTFFCPVQRRGTEKSIRQ
jgi:hypothetical protein